VVSIEHLEPMPGDDPYGRHRPWHPEAVETETGAAELRQYEAENIVGKRTRRYGRTQVDEYRVRWKGFGADLDDWMTVNQLKHCQDLVEKYEREHTGEHIHGYETRGAARQEISRQEISRQEISRPYESPPLALYPNQATTQPTARSEPTPPSQPDRNNQNALVVKPMHGKRLKNLITNLVGRQRK